VTPLRILQQNVYPKLDHADLHWVQRCSLLTLGVDIVLPEEDGTAREVVWQVKVKVE
jgi:hypothetical protein